MPSANYQIQIQTPLDHVWAFVSDVDNWAPLVKGYDSHLKHNCHHSVWTLKGEVGRIRKTIQIDVDIEQSASMEHLVFRLTGITDNIHGTGSFTAEKITEKSTIVTGQLSMKANGLMGTVINPLITSMLQGQLKELAESIRSHIEEQQHPVAIF